MTTLTATFDRRVGQTVRLGSRLGQRLAALSPHRRIHRAIDFCRRGVRHVWRNRRYFTLFKLANIALVNLQFTFKCEYVVGRPYRMKIESTNICNTKCQLCPTGVGLEGRPRGRMKFEQYTRLIDHFRRHLVALDLSMWGDPLIVPDIYAMIRYAHERSIWTYVSSNLHAFKIGPRRDGSEQAELLVRSGLDLLTCSLHGATQATYELYQPGKRLDEAIAKVRHILAVRDRLKSSTPQVQLNFVVTRHNEHEKQAFQKLADELGCRAVFSWAALNTRFLDRDRKLQPLGLAPDVLAKKTKQHVEHWLPEDADHRLEIYRDLAEGRVDPQSFNGRKIFDCSWPWRQSVINWDGQVVTCCGSFEPEQDMGSVFDKPFAHIWNSRKYQLARRSFKRPICTTSGGDNPCATCPGIML